MKLIRSKNTPREGFLSVYLEKNASDGLDVKIITAAGENWFVLGIKAEGPSTLYTSIPTEQGLQVDAEGCLEVTRRD